MTSRQPWYGRQTTGRASAYAGERCWAASGTREKVAGLHRVRGRKLLGCIGYAGVVARRPPAAGRRPPAAAGARQTRGGLRSSPSPESPHRRLVRVVRVAISRPAPCPLRGLWIRGGGRRPARRPGLRLRLSRSLVAVALLRASRRLTAFRSAAQGADGNPRAAASNQNQALCLEGCLVQVGFPNSRGHTAAANLRPRGMSRRFPPCNE